MAKITVFKPAVPYNPDNQTKLDKISFQTALTLYGTLLVKTLVNNGNVYTVPNGRKFFVVNLTGSHDASGGADAQTIQRNRNDVIFEHIGVAGSRENWSLNSTFPLILGGGERIDVANINTGAGNSGSCNLVGYEIDAALLPNLT